VPAAYDPHPTKDMGEQSLSEIVIVVVYEVVTEVDVDEEVSVVVM